MDSRKTEALPRLAEPGVEMEGGVEGGREQRYTSRPWSRESSNKLVQMLFALLTLLVGTVLFTGYAIGILGGLVCYAGAMATLYTNSQSNKKLCGFRQQRWFAASQLAANLLCTGALAGLGYWQLHILHFVEDGGMCTLDMSGVTSTPLTQAADGQQIRKHCEYANNNDVTGAYASIVGCHGECMCVESSQQTGCSYECITSLVPPGRPPGE